MRIGLFIIGITIFLVVNTYYDGKYTKMFHINKKYVQMATYAFVGLSLYLFIKKNPEGSKGMFKPGDHLFPTILLSCFQVVFFIGFAPLSFGSLLYT